MRQPKQLVNRRTVSIFLFSIGQVLGTMFTAQTRTLNSHHASGFALMVITLSEFIFFVGIYFSMADHFHAKRGPLILVVSLLIGLLALNSLPWEIWLLWGIAILIWLLPSFQLLNLHNVPGLLTISLTAIFLPLTIYFVRNDNMQLSYVWHLLPYIASFGFFFEPLWVRKPENWWATLLSLFILVAVILALPLTWRNILAILLVTGFWLWRHSSINNYLIVASTAQLITLLLLFA